MATVDDARAADGVEHLQRAALEAIGAARAFLDVAEQVVSDPDAVAEAVAGLASLADLARRAGTDAARGAAGGAAGPSGAAEGHRDDRPEPTAHVETIPVT